MGVGLSPQTVGPRSIDEIMETVEVIQERETRIDKTWNLEVPPFPVERPCIVDASTAGYRPAYVPAFLPAFPEPFTYKATESDVEAREQGSASVKRHHTQLVREVPCRHTHPWPHTGGSCRGC